MSAGCGAYAVLWQLCAKSKPNRLLPQSNNSGPPVKTDKAVEWGIFKCNAVHAMTSCFVTFGTLNYSMLQLAPLYFIEKLKCTSAEAAGWLAIVNSINLPGTFLSGALESFLLKWGVPLLTVRKRFSLIATTGSSIAAIFYGMAQTPLQACLGYSLYTVSVQGMASSMFPNFMELGGQDTAILNSVANSLANIPGFLVAPVGLLLRQWTGSWATQYIIAAMLHILTGFWYAGTMSLTPARNMLLQDTPGSKIEPAEELSPTMQPAEQETVEPAPEAEPATEDTPAHIGGVLVAGVEVGSVGIMLCHHTNGNDSLAELPGACQFCLRSAPARERLIFVERSCAFFVCTVRVLEVRTKRPRLRVECLGHSGALDWIDIGDPPAAGDLLVSDPVWARARGKRALPHVGLIVGLICFIASDGRDHCQSAENDEGSRRV
jgi:hypothetical protein